MYKRDVNRRFVRGIYEESICMTWGTNEDYIGLKPKVCGSILGSLYSKIRNLNNNFNGISPTDRQINKKIKLDVGTVFMILC